MTDLDAIRARDTRGETTWQDCRALLAEVDRLSRGPDVLRELDLISRAARAEAEVAAMAWHANVRDLASTLHDAFEQRDSLLAEVDRLRKMTVADVNDIYYIGGVEYERARIAGAVRELHVFAFPLADEEEREETAMVSRAAVLAAIGKET